MSDSERKYHEAHQAISEYERKYGMGFAAFKAAWKANAIPDRYSFEVEQDYWEWEAWNTDERRLGLTQAKE